MQSFYNQTARFFKAQNFELIKEQASELYRTQKVFLFQVLDLFLIQANKSIKSDNVRLIALTIFICFIFNLLFWLLFHRTKQVLKKLRDEIETLRKERKEIIEKLTTDMYEKMEDIELEALGTVHEAIEKINIAKIENNLEVLCDDVSYLEETISLMRKENSKFLAVKKSVSKVKDQCAENSKLLAFIEQEVALLSDDVATLNGERYKNDPKNECAEDKNDSDYTPTDDEKYTPRVRKSEPITIENYNEKSFAVYGNTKKYKEEMKALGGKWCPNLIGRKGWIFSNKKKPEVEAWFQSLSIN